MLYFISCVLRSRDSNSRGSHVSWFDYKLIALYIATDNSIQQLLLGVVPITGLSGISFIVEKQLPLFFEFGHALL